MSNYTIFHRPPPLHPLPGQVSWQSAFWPVIACVLTLMMQSTGRVCGAPMRYSAALRSSLLICVIDAFMIIAKFAWLLLLGCSIRVAARHVWYDRFEEGGYDIFADIEDRVRGTSHLSTSARNHPHDLQTAGDQLKLKPQLSNGKRHYHERDESDSALCTFTQASPSERANTATQAGSSTHARPPTHTNPSTQRNDNNTYATGVEHVASAEEASLDSVTTEYRRMHQGSTIDRTWRLNIGAFVLGAVPQMVKVFSMQGIPFTTVAITITLVLFAVPEIFRIIAGSAGEVDLRPTPVIITAKECWDEAQRVILVFYCAVQLLVLTIILCMLPFRSQSTFSAFALIGLQILVTIVVHPATHWLSKSIFKVFHLTCLNTVWAWFNKLVRGFSEAINFALESPAMETYLTFIHVDKSVVLSFFFILPMFLSLGVSLGPIRDRVYSITETIDGDNASCPALVIFLMAVEMGTVTSVSFLLVFLYVIYRLIFRGRISRYPRKLTGVDGSLGAFCSGTFILGNLGAHFLLYIGVIDPWDPSCTYKPSWAENLG